MATKKKDATTSYPFPYYGEGSATPVRGKDGLIVLLVFADLLPLADAQAMAALAPSAFRVKKVEPRVLFLQTVGRPPTVAELTAFAKRVHEAHPVALFFVGSDGKRGPWHRHTVARFGELVRPVIDLLRAEGHDLDARWIAVSFLRGGAATTYDDIRQLADEDPVGHLADLNKRCLLALPLVQALGPASLVDLGPYAELCFWACSSISEFVPDPMAHAAHVIALADACPAKRQPAVPHALVRTATSLMHDAQPLAVSVEQPKRTPKIRHETFEAALAIGRRAATPDALPLGLLDFLVDAARTLGGAKLAVAMVKPFLGATIAALPKTRDLPTDAETLDAFVAFEKRLRADLAKAPDAEVSALLATAPKPLEKEVMVKGASHPHLARLNADRLTVSYRGSSEWQEVTIVLTGSPEPPEAGEHFRRMRDLAPIAAAGLAGGSLFAPETGAIEVLAGPSVKDAVRDATWKLRVRGVSPGFLPVMLHFLSNTWTWSGGKSIARAPRHVRITGTLAPMDDEASATTETVLALLKKPTAAYQAYPEQPLPVGIARGKGTALVLKPVKLTAKAGAAIEDASFALRHIFEAYPKGAPARVSRETSKTQVKVSWVDEPLPRAVSRGPLLNFARAMHVNVTPLAGIELGE